MITTCPACYTGYLVADHLLGLQGRTVQCARCQHRWWQEPADPHKNGRPLPEMAQTNNKSGQGSDKTPSPASTSNEHTSHDSLTVADLPRKIQLPAIFKPPVPKRWIFRTWGKACVGLGIGIILLLGLQRPLIKIWPGLNAAYGWIGLDIIGAGLEITDVRTLQTPPSDMPELTALATLVVEGRIINVTRSPQPLPSLRVIVREEGTNRWIQEWTFHGPVKELAPLQSVVVQSTLYNPPANKVYIQLEFAVPTAER